MNHIAHPFRLAALIAGCIVAAFGTSQNGVVFGWGNNGNGQTTPPAGLQTVEQVSSTLLAGLALKADGTVVGWGYNFRGETSIPVGLTGVKQIATGAYHVLALKGNGTVVGWGWNYNGQVTIPAGLSNVTKVACGFNHSLALKADGTLVAWGYNASGQATIPAGLTGVIDVAAGDEFSVAVKANGTVVAWGNNSAGQCTIPFGLGNVVKVAARVNHVLALKSNGGLSAWGSNTHGESTVPNYRGVAIAIAVGDHHSMALLSSGQVLSWGSTNFGLSPTPSGLFGVQSVAANGFQSLAVVKHNKQPVADAGVDQIVPSTGPVTTVTLDATGSSDPEGLPLTYEWLDGNTVLGGNTIQQANLVPGTHLILLIATDVWGLRDTGVVSVTVVKQECAITFDVPVPYSGKSYVGKVNLPAPAPAGGVTFNMDCTDERIVIAPQVTVLAGKNSGTFTITTEAIDDTISATITARHASYECSVLYTLSKAKLQSIDDFNPQIIGGASASWGVTLNGKAGPSGAVVTLFTGSAAIADVPATVNVDAGFSAASFKVDAQPVDSATAVTLWAKFDGTIRVANLLVTPAVPKMVNLAAPDVVGGTQLGGNTVQLLGLAGPSGVNVELTSSNPAVASVPASLVIGAGKNLGTFKITTSAVGTATDVTISSTANGVTKTAILNVHA